MKLLKAHYAGAVPVNLLKSEMGRIEQETADATRLKETAEEPVGQLEERLADLERFVSSCQLSYLTAGTRDRRRINRALFEKLFVGRDGVVASAPTGLLRGLVDLPEVAADSRAAAGEVQQAQAERWVDDPTPDPQGRGFDLVKVVGHQGLEP